MNEERLVEIASELAVLSAKASAVADETRDDKRALAVERDVLLAEARAAVPVAISDAVRDAVIDAAVVEGRVTLLLPVEGGS